MRGQFFKFALYSPRIFLLCLMSLTQHLCATHSRTGEDPSPVHRTVSPVAEIQSAPVAISRLPEEIVSVEILGFLDFEEYQELWRVSRPFAAWLENGLRALNVPTRIWRSKGNGVQEFDVTRLSELSQIFPRVTSLSFYGTFSIKYSPFTETLDGTQSSLWEKLRYLSLASIALQDDDWRDLQKFLILPSSLQYFDPGRPLSELTRRGVHIPLRTTRGILSFLEEGHYTLDATVGLVSSSHRDYPPIVLARASLLVNEDHSLVPPESLMYEGWKHTVNEPQLKLLCGNEGATTEVERNQGYALAISLLEEDGLLGKDGSKRKIDRLSWHAWRDLDIICTALQRDIDRYRWAPGGGHRVALFQGYLAQVCPERDRFLQRALQAGDPQAISRWKDIYFSGEVPLPAPSPQHLQLLENEAARGDPRCIEVMVNRCISQGQKKQALAWGERVYSQRPPVAYDHWLSAKVDACLRDRRACPVVFAVAKLSLDLADQEPTSFEQHVERALILGSSLFGNLKEDYTYEGAFILVRLLEKKLRGTLPPDFTDGQLEKFFIKPLEGYFYLREEELDLEGGEPLEEKMDEVIQSVYRKLGEQGNPEAIQRLTQLYVDKILTPNPKVMNYYRLSALEGYDQMSATTLLRKTAETGDVSALFQLALLEIEQNEPWEKIAQHISHLQEIAAFSENLRRIVLLKIRFLYQYLLLKRGGSQEASATWFEGIAKINREAPVDFEGGCFYFYPEAPWHGAPKHYEVMDEDILKRILNEAFENSSEHVQDEKN